ncbi:MAG: hypothetical protein ABIP50_01720 [Candidatus Saccharimonadales bacterium]
MIYVEIAHVFFIIKSNMVKIKNKNVHTPLVVTGYVLFVLLVIATLLTTTIPWAQLLAANLTKVSHYNIAVFFVALTVGSLLPVLVGYLIGGSSVRSKSKLNHHFNGILFSLLAFWIMTIFAVLVIFPSELFNANPNERIVLSNLLPGFVVAIITTIIAIAHVHSRQAKHDILKYKLFSVPLVGSIVVLPVWDLIQNIMTNSVSIYSSFSLIIVILLGVVSYATLRKTKLNTYDMVAWSAVSISVFFVAVFVSSQLVSVASDYLFYQPTAQVYELLMWGSYAIALVGWGAYWIKQVKVMSQNRIR